MELGKTSGYAKYLVLSDNSRCTIGGNFLTYQNFKKVKDVIDNIAFSDKSTYSFEGNIYKRKVTSTEARNILNNIDTCKWSGTTSKMLLVANQLGLRI